MFDRFFEFPEGDDRLRVLVTDLTEPETQLMKMAQCRPTTLLSGGMEQSKCVYFKMPYTAPCDKFQDLRRLILRVREATGMRAGFDGVVAVDVSEWLGHEKEQYFNVLLKFLYDHRDTWHACLVVQSCAESRLERLLSECLMIMTPMVCDGRVFTLPERLEATLDELLTREGVVAEKDALAKLAGLLGSPSLARCRSLQLLDRVARELGSVPGRTVRVETVDELLSQPYTTLNMLGGMDRKERRFGYDFESLRV